jgi:hypothetical protein
VRDAVFNRCWLWFRPAETFAAVKSFAVFLIPRGLKSGYAARSCLHPCRSRANAIRLIAALLICRTALEDRTLRQELAGYEQLTALTRYRLIPRLW